MYGPCVPGRLKLVRWNPNPTEVRFPKLATRGGWSVAGGAVGLAAGALGASRKRPSSAFAPNDRVKEAHDSEVS